MTPDDVALRPLHPGQLRVMRLRALGPAIAIVAAAAVVEFRLLDRSWPHGILVVAALAIAAWSVGPAPARRFRRWSFAFTDRELHVAHGWLVRFHTVVPIARVQHIDLRQGPAERRYGVATLVLHTAGTEHSEVMLPGLARAEAESIRDRIRSAISEAA